MTVVRRRRTEHAQGAPPGAVDARQELTAGEIVALEHGGLDLDADEGGADDPFLRTAAEYAALLATSLTVAQAAALLKVQPSRVRQRLVARTLYGLRGRHGWRLPRFQFDHGRPLPDMETVLPRVPPDVHPVALLRWLTSPKVDLVVGPDETPVSPRDWLRMGNDPSVVAHLAAEL